jgi:dTDP-4-amino-4,6-dideoxygalactose transaminase
MKIPLYYPYRGPEVESVCIEILRSGYIAAGPYVDSFTKAFGELVGQENVVTMSDISDSIQFALHLADVKEGDEVLALPYSCMSSNSPIAAVKATAVWVDMDPSTGTIDLNSLKRSISKKSKALILYHVAGYPAPVEEVSKICREHGIVLIEDCNNALLSTYNSVQVGTWGDFAAFSFYPNRQINAGEGGALVCRRKSDANRAKLLKRYGIDSSTFRTANGEIDPGSNIPEIGWAAALNNLCSGMGYVQIESVKNRIDITRKNAELIRNCLVGNKNIFSIEKLPEANPNYWVYLVRSPNRDALMDRLKKSGIMCSKVHQLNNVYTGFKGSFSFGLSGSEEFMNSVLGIPCGWWLSGEQLHYMFSKLNEKL